MVADGFEFLGLVVCVLIFVVGCGCVGLVVDFWFG